MIDHDGIFEPTVELRFVRRHIDSGWERMILQQLWVVKEEFGFDLTEWRDVPVEEEKP